MIKFEIDSNISSNVRKKSFLKKTYYFVKEPVLIGFLNGCISGAIAMILAAYGYIAIPGFGPIIATGIGITLSIGVMIGAIIGSIIGLLIATVVSFLNRLIYTVVANFSFKSYDK
ncbi:hypothetical protein [Bartonella sp. F02]|uniref:hypothetical protein n=1 Tax=Bartonella sp. F02 TaxID=2967262 RepID=UPI0022A91997|nr:hypothetical protein [Bartonella sp. F02]MCZ2328257.1 hypothetical protein [Bartonella sp. F02]